MGSAYLDYRGPTSSADPREATELLNAPMPDSKINSAIRVMLQEACGMSKEQAAGYSKHSVLCAPLAGDTHIEVADRPRKQLE